MIIQRIQISVMALAVYLIMALDLKYIGVYSITDPNIRKYEAINIEIDENVGILRDQCQHILAAIEKTLVSASDLLYKALEMRYYFSEFNIILPQTWNESCIPATLLNGTDLHAHMPYLPHHSMNDARFSDVIVMNLRSRSGDDMWTNQFGTCGMPGLNIFAHFESFNKEYSGKMFLKEWAKYRYGVFDEIAIDNDSICYTMDGAQHMTGCTDHELESEDLVGICNGQHSLHGWMDAVPISPLAQTSLMTSAQGANVALFCNSSNHNRYAPTKQNYLCDRSSIIDVMLEHKDFLGQTISDPAENHKILEPPQPKFNYKRRSLTRYVVVVDDSLDMSIRESWSFLRSAFRKWALYDLIDNSEVSVMLVNGKNVSKTLDITPMAKGNNRDLVASFLPYTPTDVRKPMCVSCAVNKALDMFDERRLSHGNAVNVILIIGTGFEKASDEEIQIHKMLQNCLSQPELATINYPKILKSRKSLDVLVTSKGISFSINEEKYNSEKSYLNSYVHLTTALTYIANRYHERTSGRRSPIELHRREVKDSNEQRIHGEFYLDEGLGQPAGFFIYTHSVETPLIQSMRLVSPSGVEYQSRSDQRIPVKQLMLLSPLNESGTWTYEIDRYPGNPQPHFVEVLATPQTNVLPITAYSWVVRYLDCFMLYTHVSHGYEPVIDANIEVVIEQRNSETYSILKHFVLELFDDGNGDIDITPKDGIYSRKLKITTDGMFTFEFFTKSNAASRQSFYRYSPLLTHFVEPNEEVDGMNTVLPVRVLNLKCSEEAPEMLNFTWTLENTDIDGYELRYTYSLHSIVDHFEQANLLMESNIDIYNFNDRHFNYQHDISNTPILYGKTVFFALRPKLKQQQSVSKISNIIELYISEPVTTTILPFSSIYDDSTNPINTSLDLENDRLNNQTNSTVEIIGISAVSYKLYILLSCLLALILLTILGIFCLFKKCQRKCIVEKKSKPDLEVPALKKANNSTTDQINTTNTATNVSECVNVQNENDGYSVLEVNLQDHQTIGIPVYVSEKRLSICGGGGGNNGFFAGINTISTYDNYLNDENWPAGTHQLRDQAYLSSPSDQSRSLSAEDAVPPVPPLPFPLLNSTTNAMQHCGGGLDASFRYTTHMHGHTLSTRDCPQYNLAAIQQQQPAEHYNNYEQLPSESLVSTIDIGPGHIQNFAEHSLLQQSASNELRRCRNVTMV